MRNGISELVTLQSTILKELITQSERKQSDYIDSVLEQHIQELMVLQSAFLTTLHLPVPEEIQETKKEKIPSRIVGMYSDTTIGKDLKRLNSLRLSEQLLYTINLFSLTSNCNKTYTFEFNGSKMGVHYTKKPWVDKEGKYIWHSKYTLYIYNSFSSTRRVVLTAQSQKELGKQIFLYFIKK